jgi:glycosyltransferase involved in cell wall biosynthesis
MDLVSILIPAHNAENWIAATIRSAIDQSWPFTEIIVVDDGSTDRTFSIARQFESDAVRVVQQEQQGASAARNTAFSLSRGQYIQWLDADDLLHRDKIFRQMQVARTLSPRTVISGAWAHFVHRVERARFVPSLLWRDLTPLEFLLYKLGRRAFMQTAVWLVSREVTEAAGPWDTKLTLDDDGEYFARVLLASDAIRFVPDAKVYYRCTGSGSLSSVGVSTKKLESLWRSMRLQVSYLRSLEESERTRAACISYLQSYVEDFYSGTPSLLDSIRDALRTLGVDLQPPSMTWKYSWIRAMFGWHIARRAQFFLRNLKWSVIRSWDKAALRFTRAELG